MTDSGHFELVSSAEANLPLVLNTDQRRDAWKSLPDPPATFGYSEGEQLVKAALHSSSSYQGWMKQCRRLKVILDTSDGKLVKSQEKRKGWGQD
jgi:hypothetical protein